MACECDSGYKNTTAVIPGWGPRQCAPINKCQGREHNDCHANATCSHVGPGVHVCDCNKGFYTPSGTKIGTQCKPWTMCNASSGQEQATVPSSTANRVCVSCGKNAFYDASQTSCSCRSTFVLVGSSSSKKNLVCVPKCPTHAHINQASWLCVCDNGFKNTSYRTHFGSSACTATGTCNSSDAQLCHVNATCARSVSGTASCSCNAGYYSAGSGTAQGKLCKPWTVCKVGQNILQSPDATRDRICNYSSLHPSCGKNAALNKSTGVCSCNHKFVAAYGNGTCLPACNTVNHAHFNQSTFVCSCDQGFHDGGLKSAGFGSTQCKALKSCSGMSCHSNSQCVMLSATQHICGCDRGFFNDSNSSCAAWKQCSSTQIEVIRPDSTHDRKCGADPCASVGPRNKTACSTCLMQHGMTTCKGFGVDCKCFKCPSCAQCVQRNNTLKECTAFGLDCQCFNASNKTGSCTGRVHKPNNGGLGTCTRGYLNHQENCKLVCNEYAGYMVSPTSTQPRCTERGVLVQDVACIPMFCKDRVNVSGEGVSFGTCNSSLKLGAACQLACTQGYKMSSSTTQPECSMNGVLTQHVMCVKQVTLGQVNYCQEKIMPPTNGGFGNCESRLQYNSSCNMTCANGYEISSLSTQPVCDHRGHLTAHIVCSSQLGASLSYCRDMIKLGEGVAYGTCKSDLAYRKSCNLTCEPGYLMSAYSTQPSCSGRGILTQHVTCKSTRTAARTVTNVVTNEEETSFLPWIIILVLLLLLLVLGCVYAKVVSGKSRDAVGFGVDDGDFNSDMVEEHEFDNPLSARPTHDNASLERQARDMEGRTTVVDLDSDEDDSEFHNPLSARPRPKVHHHAVAIDNPLTDVVNLDSDSDDDDIGGVTLVNLSDDDDSDEDWASPPAATISGRVVNGASNQFDDGQHSGTENPLHGAHSRHPLARAHNAHQGVPGQSGQARRYKTRRAFDGDVI